MKHFIISLKKSKDRREYISNTFKYKFEYFDAIDGSLLFNSKYNDKLNIWQRGCFESHLLLWKKILKEPDSLNFYIFEDDVEITGNIHTTMPIDFDILFLGHIAETKGELIFKNIYKSVFPRGLHAYIISKKGIKKLLQYFETFEEFILPIDELIALAIYKNILKAYSIFPPVAKQCGMKSTINI
jgi:GR25 family glycosyltransferase involved in LPS biosynthesis